MSLFIRRATRTVYENPWVRFEAHDFVRPNGDLGEHAVVVTPIPSAVVVLDGDEVVFTKQPRYAIDRVVLEIVKGGSDPGESPRQCAEREMREEIGLEAARWDELGIGYEIPSIVRSPVHLFLARDLTHVEAEKHPAEPIECVRIPFAEALAATVRGEIDDSISALALLRAQAVISR